MVTFSSPACKSKPVGALFFDHQLNKETKLPCWYRHRQRADGPGAKKPVNALLPNATRELTPNHGRMECVHGVCELNVGRKLDVGGKRSVPGAR